MIESLSSIIAYFGKEFNRISYPINIGFFEEELIEDAYGSEEYDLREIG